MITRRIISILIFFQFFAGPLAFADGGTGILTCVTDNDPLMSCPTQVHNHKCEELLKTLIAKYRCDTRTNKVAIRKITKCLTQAEQRECGVRTATEATTCPVEKVADGKSPGNCVTPPPKVVYLHKTVKEIQYVAAEPTPEQQGPAEVVAPPPQPQPVAVVEPPKDDGRADENVGRHHHHDRDDNEDAADEDDRDTHKKSSSSMSPLMYGAMGLMGGMVLSQMFGNRNNQNPWQNLGPYGMGGPMAMGGAFGPNPYMGYRPPGFGMPGYSVAPNGFYNSGIGYNNGAIYNGGGQAPMFAPYMGSPYGGVNGGNQQYNIGPTGGTSPLYAPYPGPIGH